MTTTFLRHGAGALVAAAIGMGAAAYTAPVVASSGDQIFQRRNQPTTAKYSRADAEIVARRLYLGLLNREPDPTGLSGTIDALTEGQLQRRVNEMVQSDEFRKNTATKPAREVLTQFYQGLLGREPDQGGFEGFLPRVQRRQYAQVVVEMVNSPEFKNKLSNAPPSGTPATPADTGAAVNCMEQVVEKVRNDLPGAVLLRFESAATEGAAFDVLDGNRRLNYNCNNGVSYSYEDNRNSRSAPAESDFPNESVRACQSAVRAQVGRERNNVDVAFESAGFMPANGRLAVRGLGFEKPQGANFHYQCDVDGTRVVNSSYRVR
jgi:hypothetical protein